MWHFSSQNHSGFRWGGVRSISLLCIFVCMQFHCMTCQLRFYLESAWTTIYSRAVVAIHGCLPKEFRYDDPDGPANRIHMTEEGLHGVASMHCFKWHNGFQSHTFVFDIWNIVREKMRKQKCHTHGHHIILFRLQLPLADETPAGWYNVEQCGCFSVSTIKSTNNQK